ncbi:MAG TPA: BatA domain-containing protein [Gemmatimonadaceae bacterium]
MSWLLPSAVAIAGVAALATIALHFIARSRPLSEPLPTARFIPDRPIHARTRSVALTDILLLLLRVAALVALGVAVAGPVFAAGRGRIARVVVVDRSRAVANVAAVRDSARAYLRSGDALVVFDSSAHAVANTSLDSVRESTARGSLSAALVAATRAAVNLASHADSIDVVLISPLAAEEVDAATSRIRASWPGVVRLVSVAPVADPKSAPIWVQSTSGANDPIVAGLALAGAMSSVADAPVRLVRTRVSAADTAWARLSSHVLIHWPMADSTAIWPKRVPIDAIGAATSRDGATIVGRFPRLWTLSGATIARWADGEPAGTEHLIDGGCIRDIGLLVDPASDLTLRPSFRAFVAPLLAPCGGVTRAARIDSATFAVLARRGSLASADGLRDGASTSSRWMPWLLALGALLLIAELAVRRSDGQPL